MIDSYLSLVPGLGFVFVGLEVAYAVRGGLVYYQHECEYILHHHLLHTLNVLR